MEGRVAIVTGAARGIGAAIARTLAAHGATLLLADLDRPAVEALAVQLPHAHALQADVADAGDAERLAHTAETLFGRIDILNNNVGVAGMGGPIELSEADWDGLIAANLNGVFLNCKHVLPIMLGQGKGAIANLSSVAAIRWTGYPHGACYAAKAGVNQLTVGLALQHAAQGIRANDPLPGFIDTPLIHKQISGQYASDAAMIAARNAASTTGCVGTPWDVANAAVFFASDAAGYLNGVCLPVDGGLSCRAA